ncbi:MAG: NAD-dependent epimerase/dehydratase family protein, partial [Dethiobacteria bacterium]
MILVTGGAGYIGSHVVRDLINMNFKVTVMDNLSTGHRSALPPDVDFIEADLLNESLTREILLKIRPQAVIHFAAKSIVSDSVANPLTTFNTNVVGTINLLKAMQLSGTKSLVFSSTAAVYGEPEKTPIEESHAL